MSFKIKIISQKERKISQAAQQDGAWKQLQFQFSQVSSLDICFAGVWSSTSSSDDYVYGKLQKICNLIPTFPALFTRTFREKLQIRLGTRLNGIKCCAFFSRIQIGHAKYGVGQQNRFNINTL